MKRRLFIYGLYDNDGLCHYAGQTRSPRLRKQAHQKHGLHFKILRACSFSSAKRIETQVINAYQRKGECFLNKQGGSEPGRYFSAVCDYLGFRVPRDIADELRRVARKHHRSVSATIVFIVREWLGKPEQGIHNPRTAKGN